MLETHCACSKLRRSARIVTSLYDAALAPSGLSVAQFALLRSLARTGPGSLTAFGEATCYDRSTLNRTLRPLEEAGYVASAAGPDRRARLIDITDKARSVIAAAEPHWRDAEARIDEALGEQRDALFAILDRVEELRA